MHFNVKSLFLLKHIGYYYIFNNNSISHSVNLDSYLKCFFIFLKFIVENTKNNRYEKYMNFFVLEKYIIIIYLILLKIIQKYMKKLLILLIVQNSFLLKKKIN